MSAIEYAAAWPLDGPQLLQESGTFFSQFVDDDGGIEALMQILAWQEYQSFNELAQVRSRYSFALSGDHTDRAFYRERCKVTRAATGEYLIELPPNVFFVQCIYIAPDTYLEHGRDYYINRGYAVCSVPLRAGNQECYFYNATWITGDLSQFWTSVAGIRDETDDTKSLLQAFVNAIQNQGSEKTFRELSAEVFGCPIPSSEQQVLDVYQQQDCPVVVLTEETLVGPENSMSLVNVGDIVQAQQDVFSAVRYWSAVSEFPTWVNSLKIPQRYFANLVDGKLEFDNQMVATTVQQGPSPQIPFLLEFPITGDVAHVRQFWNFVRQRELEIGEPVYAHMMGSEPGRLAAYPQLVNPLEFIRELWLQYGVSVSFVTIPSSVELLRRAQLLRRVCPPWLTHIIHFADDLHDKHPWC